MDTPVKENNDSIVRRSKRLAAKTEDKPNQLIDLVLADLERDSYTKKKNDSNFYKKKVYRNNNTNTSINNTTNNNSNNITSKSKISRDEETGTLFDNGLQAINIIGATYVDDNSKGTSELCYLIKFENGQFELVLNKVAHKFCPTLVIDFLESRILFKDKDDLDLSSELLNDPTEKQKPNS